MMENRIKFGKIHINKSCHFLASYRENYQSDELIDIALFTYDEKFNNVTINLIVHDIRYEKVLLLVKNKIYFYIFELKNNNPILYLIHHCKSVSNYYDQVLFSYIPKITSNNIIYYAKSISKIENISRSNLLFNLERKFFDLQINLLISSKISNFLPTKLYNEYLNILSDIFFNQLPAVDELEYVQPRTIIDFSKYLSRVTSKDFCQTINYFKYRKLIKQSEVEIFIKMFLVNRRYHKNT